MRPLALVGLRVWDGDGQGFRRDVDALRVEGDRIAALGRSGELCEGAEVRRLDGATALPGLIDAHVHLCIDPELRTNEQAADRQEARPAQPLDGLVEDRLRRSAQLSVAASHLSSSQARRSHHRLLCGIRRRVERGNPPSDLSRQPRNPLATGVRSVQTSPFCRQADLIYLDVELAAQSDLHSEIRPRLLHLRGPCEISCTTASTRRPNQRTRTTSPASRAATNTLLKYAVPSPARRFAPKRAGKLPMQVGFAGRRGAKTQPTLDCP